MDQIFYYFNPLTISFTVIGILFLCRAYVGNFFIWIFSQFIKLEMPNETENEIEQENKEEKVNYKKELLPALGRVVYLNWYTFLMLLLIWLLLFVTDVGKDVLVMYIENLKIFGFFGRVGSYFSLFSCTFFISLAIWIIPFFLYSEEQKKDILKNKETCVKYFTETKFLAFFAMLPFLIVTNAFFFKSQEESWLFKFFKDQFFILAIVMNTLLFAVFTALVKLLERLKLSELPVKLKMDMSGVSKNIYIVIFVRLTLLIGLIALTLALFNLSNTDTNTISVVVSVFMFISSVLVFFQLLKSNRTVSDIKKYVEEILSPENKKPSRIIYLLLFFLLMAANGYYYLVPSLETTNPLYILLVVFAFFIIYLDFFRNLYKNSNTFIKYLAFGATALFLLTPLLRSNKQFRIALKPMAPGTSVLSIEDAIKERISHIITETKDSTVFIICAMGGGSRAGYITAGVLQKLDSLTRGELWKKTLAYSTVSGGSVGAYTFIKGKLNGIPFSNTEYLRTIYQKNYNSSGVFGLLIGDPIESDFRAIGPFVRKFTSKQEAPLGFYDRNVRIRYEYDYEMQKALNPSNEKLNYWKKTFYPFYATSPLTKDNFKMFYNSYKAKIPIHLVNTFETNSGRRAILSPYTVTDTSLFPNAMLPLQDTSFDKLILKKDIYYREAVNMSELFPFISAASGLGTISNEQFVDGGYYENYGLSAAVDLLYYIEKNYPQLKSHVRVLLIKNSKQEVEVPNTAIQIWAPLKGIMNAPFTGHANHLQDQMKKRYGSSRFQTIEFDAKAKKVPLTRSLNQIHIETMRTFIDSLRFDNLLMNLIHVKTN